ncbi:KorB protein [Aquitalea magnusonii]|nr:KorB protein [Aquitalea magnusonii]
MNLSELSFTQLQELHVKVTEAIEQQQAAVKADAKKQILELAKAHGLSLDEVLSKSAPAARKTVEAKYRNPNDASQTWTGRGRKPAWVQAQLDEGFSLEDLAI